MTARGFDHQQDDTDNESIFWSICRTNVCGQGISQHEQTDITSPYKSLNYSHSRTDRTRDLLNGVRAEPSPRTPQTNSILLIKSTEFSDGLESEWLTKRK